MDVIHEYEDTDDEWARDGCREIGPLNDVTFLIQRIHEGTIGRPRNRPSPSLPPPSSFDLSFHLSPGVHVYIGGTYRRNRSVSCRWYPDNILAATEREREREPQLAKPATVSVTLHPPRTNNVQLDTLLPAPTSGSSSNGGRSLSSSLLLGGGTPFRPSPFNLASPSLPCFAIHHCPCASFVHGIPTYIYPLLLLLLLLLLLDLRNSRSSRAGKHRPVRTHLGFAVFRCV